MELSDFLRELEVGMGEMPENWVLLSSVDSTNRMARRLVERLSEEDESVPGFVVIALHQTSGRGRGGRAWWSPPGAGLYATRAAGIDPGELGLLPLRVPLGLCEALDRFLPQRSAIKWPNDLLVGGRKIGGILIEALKRSPDKIEVLIGFGINLSHPTAEMPSLAATSLSHEMTRPPTLAELAHAAMAGVEAAIAATSATDPYVIERFRSRLAHSVGDRLRVRFGEERLEGRFLGVDESGFLRLEVGSEERRIAAGEIIE